MFLAVAAGLSIASQLAGMYEQTQAESAQLQQLELQQKQKNLQLTQKKLSVYGETKKVLARQQAQATVRGIGSDSPSLNAIQRDTLNISSKALQNLKTEEEMSKYSSDVEGENVRLTTHAQLFGETASIGQSFALLSSTKLKK